MGLGPPGGETIASVRAKRSPTRDQRDTCVWYSPDAFDKRHGILNPAAIREAASSGLPPSFAAPQEKNRGENRWMRLKSEPWPRCHDASYRSWSSVILLPSW